MYPVIQPQYLRFASSFQDIFKDDVCTNANVKQHNPDKNAQYFLN